MKPEAYLDVESFYSEEVSIRNRCMKYYMADSYAYLVSVVCGEFAWAGSFDELRKNAVALSYLMDPDRELYAVNSNFDQEWTERMIPELVGFGKVWRCVSDYAAYHQYPRALDKLFFALTGKKLSKAERTQMKDVHWQEIMVFEQDRIRAYNINDNFAARHCLHALQKRGTMSATEEAVAAHTRMICRRGIKIDEEFIEKCRTALEWARHNVRQKLPWANTEPPLSVQAFNTFCCKHGTAPPANLRKGDADFSAWMELNPKLAPMLRLRQQFELANRKLSHIEKMLSRSYDGFFYPDILYCGAPHTRRFSSKASSDGSQTGDSVHSGFNIQNMDRAPVLGDLLPEFFSPLPPLNKQTKQPLPGIMLRNALVPREGKKFVVLDFAQIEPRSLYWLAGCEELLQKIRDGFSIYEAFARSVRMWDKPTPLKETADIAYYVLVKNAAIGSGYGMGGQKFARYAKISEDIAIPLIEKIRRNNPRVPAFWRQMQELIVESAYSNDSLKIVMPNREKMLQFHVESYMRAFADGETRQAYRAEKVYGEREKKPGQNDIYGAKLVENVTQRLARDLLAEAVLKIEAAGMPVCFHAHDEVILEVDESDAGDALVEARRLMEEVPEWAAGLPIEASGGLFDRYCKAD